MTRRGWLSPSVSGTFVILDIVRVAAVGNTRHAGDRANRRGHSSLKKGASIHVSPRKRQINSVTSARRVNSSKVVPSYNIATPGWQNRVSRLFSPIALIMAC